MHFDKNMPDPKVSIFFQLAGIDKDSYELYIYDVDEIAPDVLYDPIVGIEINSSAPNYTPPKFISAVINNKVVSGNIVINDITRTSVHLEI